MFSTPILFLVFNRPEETRLVFEVIRKLEPKCLYIAADGPRLNRAGENELCDEVQTIVAQVDWVCEVKKLFRDKNVGCKKAVSEAITWFFENVEQGIILEDDCLPDSSFFPYCEELLERYKDDESIISIGGTNLGYTFSGDHSYAFSRFMNMWGWATWRRSAKLVDYDMGKWKNMRFKNVFLHCKLQDNLFSLDYNWIKFWKNYFNLTLLGKIDTWDYQWIFTQLYFNKKAVFPAQNLVKNIGFTENATHTIFPDHPITQLNIQSIVLPIKHPDKINIDLHYEKKCIKKVWFSYKNESFFNIVRSDILNSSVMVNIKNFLKSKKNT
jgi:hypothetical protein